MTKNVYLSGGLVTRWQDEVIRAVPDASYYNPASFEMEGMDRLSPRLYAPMDMYQIRDCDIFFGYLESSNPTPINVILELGYAKGLNKTTILCNEWTEESIKNSTLKAVGYLDKDGRTWFKPHYLDLVLYMVDFVETDLGMAMQILKKLVE